MSSPVNGCKLTLTPKKHEDKNLTYPLIDPGAKKNDFRVIPKVLPFCSEKLFITSARIISRRQITDISILRGIFFLLKAILLYGESNVQ